MLTRRLFLLALVPALALLAPACATEKAPADPHAGHQMPASTDPHIYFQSPRNGDVVAQTFPVIFGLQNYGVAPAGVNFPKTGHFHVLINVEPPATGEIIPADSLHRHFGGGQIESTLTLAPGAYTLRLVLADSAHRVIGPQLNSAPITVTVR